VFTDSSGRVSKTWTVIISEESAIISVPTRLRRITSLIASLCSGLILPDFAFRCIILYPAKYIEITFRFKEFSLSVCVIIAVASLIESEDLKELGTIDKDWFVSLIILTRSPAFKFISFIHFFGKDKI
jgi:hypothetical protein